MAEIFYAPNTVENERRSLLSILTRLTIVNPILKTGSEEMTDQEFEDFCLAMSGVQIANHLILNHMQQNIVLNNRRKAFYCMRMDLMIGDLISVLMLLPDMPTEAQVSVAKARDAACKISTATTISSVINSSNNGSVNNSATANASTDVKGSNVEISFFSTFRSTINKIGNHSTAVGIGISFLAAGIGFMMYTRSDNKLKLF